MADIQITELTDGALDANNNWSGTGIFDKLIEAVNKNIEGQYNKSRINGTDYANVYLGSVQSVIAQSMQFVLQEKQIEADIALKEKQLEISAKELEIKQTQLVLTERQVAEIENSIELAKNSDTRAQVQLDDQLLTSELQRVNLERDIATKEKQIAQIEKQIDISERDMVEKESTGVKQRLLLDDEHTTALKNHILLDTEEEIKTAQLAEVTDATLRANTQLDDQLLTSEVQRNQGEIQIAAIEKDIEKANSEINILNQKVVGRKQSTVNAE